MMQTVQWAIAEECDVKLFDSYSCKTAWFLFTSVKMLCSF